MFTVSICHNKCVVQQHTQVRISYVAVLQSQKLESLTTWTQGYNPLRGLLRETSATNFELHKQTSCTCYLYLYLWSVLAAKRIFRWIKNIW